MKVYIASPYTADTEEEQLRNTLVNVDTGIRLMHLGYTPFIPLLSHWLDMRAKELSIDMPYELYMDYDFQWIRQCDAVLVLGRSNGVDREIAFAESYAIPVCYVVEELRAIEEILPKRRL